MNLLSRSATAVVAALALAVPAVAVTALSADASPTGASKADHAPAAKKAKTTVKLKRSAAYSHVGQSGVKVTATVTKGSKKMTGKVAFSVNGKSAQKSKLRKGKASYKLPKGKKPGTYKVSAKYKGTKKTVKVRVFNSAISLSATSFTISKSASSSTFPKLSGSVKFKNKTAKTGYVDFYQNGKVKGGSSSPAYCCFGSVKSDGTFDATYSFFSRMQDKSTGTYKYQAFYTATASWGEYIYSAPITVTVTS